MTILVSNSETKLAHSPFGGSIAARILRCPGSVGLVAKVPPHLIRSSVHADRGTACHEAIALLLIADTPRFDLLAGQTFNNYTLTNDDVENAIRPAFDCAVALLEQPGAEFLIEQRVRFPGIPNAFGTTDLAARIGDVGHIVDFKFGSGVRVRALTPDGDEDVINAQGLYYIAGARHTLPRFLNGVSKFVLTIVQPQALDTDADDGVASSVEVTHEDLNAFETAFQRAASEALGENPRLERGAHCRFCPAKPICPLHTGPLLDLARFTMPAMPPLDKAAYLAALGAGLDLLEALKDMRATLHDQAKRAVEAGDTVPGFMLSAGRAERAWKHSDHVIIAALSSLGLKRDDLINEELRSPRQVELRAKPHGIKVPPELIESHRSGSSLVRCENARAPVPGRDAAMQSLSGALDRLTSHRSSGAPRCAKSHTNQRN
jgi:hypothetical protein